MAETTNLLQETLADMAKHGKEPKDVLWCGSEKYGRFTWDDFVELSNSLDYDDSYGSPKIAIDLVICGDSWWMARGEYDGSEWWNFLTHPGMPNEYKKPKRLGGDHLMWPKLKEDDDEEERRAKRIEGWRKEE